MTLRRTATALVVGLAVATGASACNGEDAGRAVDKGVKDAKQAGQDAKRKVDNAVDKTSY